MTITAELARPYFGPLGGLRNTDFIREPKFKTAIMRGLADSREGRVKPWSEVKRELGLE